MDINTKYGIAKEMGYGEAYTSSKTLYIGWHYENSEEYCIWKHKGQLYHQLQKYSYNKLNKHTIENRTEVTPNDRFGK